MKTFFAYLRISVFMLWLFVMMPFLYMAYKIKPFSPYFNIFYFNVACFILGIKSKIVKGKMANMKNLLLLSNHNSYFDIFAIGKKLKINFVSKNDVRNWPIFGIITKLGNSVFISRDKMRAKNEINLIEDAIESRKIPLLLFPEGTSSDGNEVLPFKSSIFAMFESHIGKKVDNQIVVQPISIAYKYEGKKLLSDADRHNYAWFIKEQNLIEHLINAMKHAPFTVEMIIHDPIDISQFKDRKELALYCHSVVEKGYKELVNK